MGVCNEDASWRSVNLGLSAKQIHQRLFTLLRKALNVIKNKHFWFFSFLKHEDYLCYRKGIMKNYKSKQTNAD